MIGYVIALVLTIIILLVILIILFSENKEWLPAVIMIFIVCIFLFSIKMERNNNQYHTKIIHRYQQGDYKLELKVDRDKVDTLYIFE